MHTQHLTQELRSLCPQRGNMLADVMTSYVQYNAFNSDNSHLQKMSDMPSIFASFLQKSSDTLPSHKDIMATFQNFAVKIEARVFKHGSKIQELHYLGILLLNKPKIQIRKYSTLLLVTFLPTVNLNKKKSHGTWVCFILFSLQNESITVKENTSHTFTSIISKNNKTKLKS